MIANRLSRRLFAIGIAGAAAGIGHAADAASALERRRPPDRARLRTLYAFRGSPDDGDFPAGALLQASDGALYGTTSGGGAYDKGTIYRLRPDGVHTTLHVFRQHEGADPRSELVQGLDGRLYGTTAGGGSLGRGTVFSIELDGSWFTRLHDFTFVDGDTIDAGLTPGLDGHFYGGSVAGGEHGTGVLFRITAAGAYTLLYSFPSRTFYQGPTHSMVRGPDGHFYGITPSGGEIDQGLFFRLTADGRFKRLYSFVTGTDIGFAPSGSLSPAADGGFFGTTSGGSIRNNGCVFHITAEGRASLVHPILAGWGKAIDEVMQASDGYLYGCYSDLGKRGVLFRLSTSGDLLPLIEVPCETNFFPNHSGIKMIECSDGRLYGVTTARRFVNPDHGSIYRLRPIGPYPD